MKTVYADNQFECLRDDLLKMNVSTDLNPTSKDKHEPFIKRSNQTVKDKIGCAFNGMPFKKMPAQMIIEMVYSSIFWLNSIVPNQGVSATLSPCELMTGKSLDANIHARYQFGEYLMLHEGETDNTTNPRALDRIYLRPSGNLQGGFWAFDIGSGQRVHQMHGTSMKKKKPKSPPTNMGRTKTQSKNQLMKTKTNPTTLLHVGQDCNHQSKYRTTLTFMTGRSVEG